MSATFGSDRNQDMMPMPRQQSSLLDPRVHIQQQQEPGEIVERGGRHRHRDNRDRRRHKRKRMDDSPPADVESPRDRGGYDSSGDYGSDSDNRDRAYESDRKRARKYRPDSPTDSVNSDFEILANKQKLKDDIGNDPTPMQRLGDAAIPPREFEDDGDEYDEYDDGDFRDRDGGDEYDSLGDGADDFGGGDVDDVFNRPARAGENAPKYTYDETLQKKAAIMVDLDRRVAAGDRIEYNDKMTLEQLTLLKNKCIHKSRGLHTIKLLRQGVTIYASVLEWVAKRFPQLNMDLTDFGKDIFARKNDFDDLLYEIHDMYAESLKVNPVIMLMLTVAAQAAMYSAARSIVKNIQSSMHFGGGGATVTSPPVIPAMPTDRLNGGGLADVDIAGPAEGFNTDDLLELCRQEMQQEQDKQQRTEQKTEAAPSITVDIPTTSDGVQIIRGGGGKKGGGGASANKKKKTTTQKEDTQTMDPTKLWDPEIDI